MSELCLLWEQITCFWISEGKEYWFSMVQRVTGKCELAWSYGKTAWEENGTTENLRKLQVRWPKNRGTKKDSQTEGRDFSELYSPPNPHLNIGGAPNRVKLARCCSWPNFPLLQWIHRSKLREEKCFSYGYAWKIDRCWIFLLENDDSLWLRVLKVIFIFRERLEIMGWAPVDKTICTGTLSRKNSFSSCFGRKDF